MRDLAFVLPIEPPRHTAQQTGLRAVYYPATQQNAARMKRAGVALVRRQARPDLDNAAKALQDALMRCGFVLDDSHVAQLFIQKFETIGAPRIAVRLREVGPFPGELFEAKDREDANAADAAQN